MSAAATKATAERRSARGADGSADGSARMQRRSRLQRRKWWRGSATLTSVALLCTATHLLGAVDRTVGWSGEHGYCELCIYAVHQVQYGSLPSCGGTTKTFSYSAVSDEACDRALCTPSSPPNVSQVLARRVQEARGSHPVLPCFPV